MPTATPLLYVGTYTWRGSQGIYAFRLDPATSELTPVGQPTPMENPSFLAPHPSGRFLYAVQETGPEGAVWAFTVGADGTLTPLNSQPSHGAAPCHLAVDAGGEFVVLANYSTGSAAAFPVREDGRLGEATCVVQHRGSGPNTARQEGPHAHSANLSPDNRRVLVADLGLDQVLTYDLDRATGALTPADPPYVSTHPGAGPRHLAFHPSGRWVYVINELDSTLTTLAHDAATGALAELQHLSTLPEGWAGESFCADIHLHPSGRFVYGSNRGHDSIAIYAVCAQTGRLTFLGCEPTRGKTPRNFAITPDGLFLLAANQDSDTVVHFRLDADSGLLEATGQVTQVPMPVCLCFMP